MTDTIDTLFELLRERQRNPQPGSYTAELLAAGTGEIARKVGEEAIEVILAAQGQGDEQLIAEMADLLYHMLVLLVDRGLTWEDVLMELEARRGGARPPAEE